MKKFLVLCTAIVTISCQTKHEFNTNVGDYDVFLDNESFRPTSKYYDLWNSKIKTDSIQLLSLGNVAGEYNRYFKNTGNIQYLKNAEKALAKAVEIAAVNKSGYQRALARNYISQHRFKEALELAKTARKWGSGLKETQSLMFDIHMELGNYGLANKYLDSIKNISDFGYLIRVAKWNDHKGDLETTIRFMEKAVKKAESSNNSALKIWSYSNIADYYGHAGRIQDSYQHYLKTLSLDPNNAYAKKGIAWIAYSYEKNGEEALRILHSIDKNFQSPDHFLLKSEIAEYLGNDKEAVQSLDDYVNLVQHEAYGNMYNTHQIEFYVDKLKNYRKALKIAASEVDNRPTPETYSLLAYTHFKIGNLDKAAEIVENHVEAKTFEPSVLLRVSEIYDALGRKKRVSELKKELMDAQYELGPITTNRVAAL